MSKSIYISFLSQPFLDSITGLSVGVPARDIDRVIVKELSILLNDIEE